MGIIGVEVATGGVAVTESENGLGVPMTLSGNGFGVPVTYVESGGLPVVTVGSGASAAIQLSPRTIPEDAAIGDLVGTLSVTNGSGTYTFTLTDDAGGLFAVDGTAVEVAGGLDYETAPNPSITVQADNGVDAPLTRTFSINVTDVEESSFDPDAQIFISRMVETPTPERAEFYNQMFIAAKAKPFWAKHVCLWVHAAHAPLAGRMNWKNNPAHDCIPINSPVFTEDRGFMGDGASSYLDTQFNPGVENHPLHQQDNASLWVRSNTDNVSTGSLAGFFANGGTTINPKDTGSTARGTARMHQFAATQAPNATSPTSIGLFLVTRWRSNEIKLFRDKVIVVDDAAKTSSPMNSGGTYRLGSINDTSFRACQFSAGGIASHLEDQDVNDLNDWLDVWLDAVGVI